MATDSPDDENNMAHDAESDIGIILEAEIEESNFVGEIDQSGDQIDIVRAAVNITKEAARAISITALEAVREVLCSWV